MFLNECGLDPGIDHIATLRLRDSITSEGGKIVSYQSYCGALFAPEYLEANPFGYKFSWSPIGVLKALKNNAVFLNDGKVVTIAQNDVLHSAKSFPGNDILKLIVYPNRDSVPYKEIYGLPDCSTVIRGTIRYQGFCEILAGFNDLGLLGEQRPSSNVTCWPELIQELVSKSAPVSGMRQIDNVVKGVAQEFTSQGVSGKIDFEKFLQVLTRHQYYRENSPEDAGNKVRKILEGMEFLGMLSEESLIDSRLAQRPIIEILCEKMKAKLTANPGDRDLVIMVHYLEAVYPGKPKGNSLRILAELNWKNSSKAR